MKSMKSKPKAKKKKFQKETPDLQSDLSNLRPPIDISTSTLCQVTKLLETGSDEVKSILAYECDFIYECRICRSLFRSLVNFISHKRLFCKGKYDVRFSRDTLNGYQDVVINSTDEVEKDSKEEHNDRILRSQVSKQQTKKDLSAVLDMLEKKQNNMSKTDISKITLESIHKDGDAVYQTCEAETESIDLMKTQVNELETIIARKYTAVLDPNGRFSDSKSEISETRSLGNEGKRNLGNEEKKNLRSNKELICSSCEASFSTRKTLAVHERTYHANQKMCYLCPCCSTAFTNTWNVYRHLCRVHRKTTDQVRQLRAQIQEKVFCKEPTAEELAEDRNKAAEDTVLRTDDTREWMDYLESDAELQRCGGCGKRFDRKAALSSHSQYCQRRIAAYQDASRSKKRRKTLLQLPRNIEPNIRNHFSKAQQPFELSTESVELSIRVAAVASLSNEDWEMMETVPIVSNGIENNNERTSTGMSSPASDSSDQPEIVFANLGHRKIVGDNVGSKKRKMSIKERVKRLHIERAKTARILQPTQNSLQAPATVERAELPPKIDHTVEMEKRLASIANLYKLQCLPCKRKFTSITNLRRHVSGHIGWNRYRCNLCDFKCFVKCDSVAHCNKMHNAQNNRTVIQEMISLIPEEEFPCNQNVFMDIPSSDDSCEHADIIVVTPLKDSSLSEAETEGESPVEEFTEQNSDEIRISQDSEETSKVLADSEPSMRNNNVSENLHAPAKSAASPDADTALRKMIMEVIFGPPEVKNKELSEDEIQESKDNNEEDHAKKEDGSTKEENQNFVKSQRPIRNRVKPMNKDFIYDLKEVARQGFGKLKKGVNECNLDENEGLKGFKPFLDNYESIGGAMEVDLTTDDFVAQCRI